MDSSCPIDNFPILIDKKEYLNKKCDYCNTLYSKLSEIETNKPCFCNVCDKCQLNSDIQGYCRGCNTQFSDFLMNKLKDKVNQRKRECKICYSDYDIENIVNLMECNHEFCKDCLNEYFDNLSKGSNIEMIFKCPECPLLIPGIQLESLVNLDLWNKIN